ncbi:hypothetical protein QQ045_006061 [Rhodiola kirilowii]
MAKGRVPKYHTDPGCSEGNVGLEPEGGAFRREAWCPFVCGLDIPASTRGARLQVVKTATSSLIPAPLETCYSMIIWLMCLRVISYLVETHIKIKLASIGDSQLNLILAKERYWFAGI